MFEQLVMHAVGSFTTPKLTSTNYDGQLRTTRTQRYHSLAIRFAWAKARPR